MSTRRRTREELTLVLVTLSRQGLSTRTLARELELNCNTVRRLLAAHAKSRESQQEAIPSHTCHEPRTSTEKETA